MLDGEPLAARTLRLFAALFEASLVVANDPTPYRGMGAPIVPDLLPGRGAPGGLHAALSTVATGWVFAAACDMPFLAEAPIQLLAARRAGAAAVLPRAGGRLHPLHGLWSRACLPVLERLLTQGEPSLVELAGTVPACVVEEEEWLAADPGGRALSERQHPRGPGPPRPPAGAVRPRAHTQRNQRSARAKLATATAASTAACGPRARQRRPVVHHRPQAVVERRQRQQPDERLHHRRGSAWRRRRRPERTNIGIITRLMRPLTVWLFRAREPTSSPSPAKASAPSTAMQRQVQQRAPAAASRRPAWRSRPAPAPPPPGRASA